MEIDYVHKILFQCNLGGTFEVNIINEDGLIEIKKNDKTILIPRNKSPFGIWDNEISLKEIKEYLK